LQDIFAKKIFTKCSRKNYKIVPLANLNKYLYNGKSEIKVNINNSSEKRLKQQHCGCVFSYFPLIAVQNGPHRSVSAVLRASKQNYAGAVFVSGGSDLEAGSPELISYSLLEQ